MSYHGYANIVKKFLYESLPSDRIATVLEVGVDRGVMLIPLVAFLARTRQQFVVMGVDIKVQDQVHLILSNLDLQSDQKVMYVEGNSLAVIPSLVKQNAKFDVVLLDGDHNYHTVTKELEHLESLTHPWSLVVIDDYDGRWSERDLFYAERPDYKDVKIATERVVTDKQGVKPAVDEWLLAHPDWEKLQPVKGEPVMLRRKPRVST